MQGGKRAWWMVPPKDSLGRGWRRGVVLTTYGGYLACVGVWALARGLASAWSFWVFLLVIPLALVTLAGLSVLVTSWIWDAANQPDAVLDERQQRVRDRAYLHSYQGLAAVFTLAAVYGAIAWDSQAKLGLWLPSTWNQVQAVLWGVLLLCITLPAAVVAWTAPDLPGEA